MSRILRAPAALVLVALLGVTPACLTSEDGAGEISVDDGGNNSASNNGVFGNNDPDNNDGESNNASNNAGNNASNNGCEATAWYADVDEDGFGDPEVEIEACEAPDGFVGQAGDCDDRNEGVHPEAEEVCNGVDDNCDEEADEGLEVMTLYVDGDGDDFGSDEAPTVEGCAADEGYAAQGGDCDDANAEIHPDAEEAVGDGVDQDCDGVELCWADADGDLYHTGETVESTDDLACDGEGEADEDAAEGDCNDNNAEIHPGAEEGVGDEVDQDCDGAELCYADADNDDYRTDEVVESVNLSCGNDGEAQDFEDAGDCADDNADINPGATEVCDDVDNDCDEDVDTDAVEPPTWYDDSGDEDGVGDSDLTFVGCDPPADGVWVSEGGDCAPTDGAVYPGAEEICDGDSEDCDEAVDEDIVAPPTWYYDGDGDGFGDPDDSIVACPAPDGYVADATDCEPGFTAVNPGADEICYDGLNNDCDAATGDTDLEVCVGPARTCDDVFEIGAEGGTFVGNLDSAEQIYTSRCDEGARTHVFQLPPFTEGSMFLALEGDDAIISIGPGACQDFGFGCFVGYQSLPPFPGGSSYLHVQGTGDYTMTVAFGADGACSVADNDSDGVTACAGDCAPSDSGTYPDAEEVCDGVDNNCDGAVDNLPGTCSVPDVDGVCAEGRRSCGDSGEVCEQVVEPGPEICGDDLDNDCDGVLDEDDCLAVVPGETCEVPEVAGQGGLLTGDLNAAEFDSPSLSCSANGGEGDWFYELDLRGAIAPQVVVRGLPAEGEAYVTLLQGCEEGFGECFYAQEGASFLVDPGVYVLGVSGFGSYALDVFVFDEGTNQCLTPNEDGDDVSPCDGDCDNSDGSIFPGAEEICDGRDNNCDGQVDNLSGACTIPDLNGVCAEGRLACDPANEVTFCQQVNEPTQEICGDNRDNDCNGFTDEPGCDNVPLGETCQLPQDAGLGGRFTGDLFEASYDYQGEACFGGEGDWFYRLDVSELLDPRVTFLSRSFDSKMVVNLLRDCQTYDLCISPWDDGSRFLEPGVYEVMLEGFGTYDLTIAVEEGATGECLTPPGDMDEVSICDGDCDDTDPSVYPGAIEVCDGKDNNCDRQVDNLAGTCTIPDLNGPCAEGRRFCNGDGTEGCQQVVHPRGEICGDMVDNDCDGSTDEPGCEEIPIGETCALPEDAGFGGRFTGNLVDAVPNYQGETCYGGEAGDWFYEMDLTDVADPLVTIFPNSFGEVSFSLLRDCVPELSCFYPFEGGSPPFPLEPGVYQLMLEGFEPYDFTVAVQDGFTGECLTPAGDTDPVSVCDGDCDDTDASVYPNAEEVCDGRDNNCDGAVDNLTGTCNVEGLFGPCAQGRRFCDSEGNEGCQQVVHPRGEICGDMVDNDCDGTVDEEDCEEIPIGETCALPEDGGLGGRFTGDLVDAVPNYQGETCYGGEAGDWFYEFDLTGYEEVEVFVNGIGTNGEVVMSLLENCEGFFGGCFPVQDAIPFNVQSGVYQVKLEGFGVYDLTIALRDTLSGECLTPAGDMDDVSICDGDCDDTDSSVFPGAIEVCDGRDDNCDGQVDNLTGTCTIEGLFGPCAEGRRVCDPDTNTEACQQVAFPSQEVCDDMRDNDCDGGVDESDATDPCVSGLPIGSECDTQADACIDPSADLPAECSPLNPDSDRGICSAPGCVEDTQCGDGNICLLEVDPPFCARDCTTNADCADGGDTVGCIDLGPFGVDRRFCYADCRLDPGRCDVSGGRCDEDSGLCFQ